MANFTRNSNKASSSLAFITHFLHSRTVQFVSPSSTIRTLSVCRSLFWSRPITNRTCDIFFNLDFWLSSKSSYHEINFMDNPYVRASCLIIHLFSFILSIKSIEWIKLILNVLLVLLFTLLTSPKVVICKVISTSILSLFSRSSSSVLKISHSVWMTFWTKPPKIRLLINVMLLIVDCFLFVIWECFVCNLYLVELFPCIKWRIDIRMEFLCKSEVGCFDFFLWSCSFYS